VLQTALYRWEMVCYTGFNERKDLETVCGAYPSHLPCVEKGGKPVRLEKIVN